MLCLNEAESRIKKGARYQQYVHDALTTWVSYLRARPLTYSHHQYDDDDTNIR
jgi:hypothetical protein